MKSTGGVAAAARAWVLEGRAVRVRVRNVREARDQRAQAARNLVGLRAQRGGRGRLTVVRAVKADDHWPPGRAAHHLDGGLDRLGPVQGDVVAGEALRRHGQEPLAQCGGQLGYQ